MNDDEARDLTETIVSFAYGVLRYGERHRYDRDLRSQLNEELLPLIDASDIAQ